jgi:hypothetical protein
MFVYGTFGPLVTSLLWQSIVASARRPCTQTDSSGQNKVAGAYLVSLHCLRQILRFWPTP